jgi:U3 small nucleolar ribonucleoprotein protein IMP4
VIARVPLLRCFIPTLSPKTLGLYFCFPDGRLGRKSKKSNSAVEDSGRDSNLSPIVMASLRRNARERKEFLYRKSMEVKDREELDRKNKLKRMLENGDKIPKELKSEEQALRREMALLGSKDIALKNIQDDEYQMSGIEDPKLLLTTSVDASSRLKAFAKEIKLIFPNCTRVNRGQTGVKALVESARNNGVTDIIVVHETRGEPDGLIVSHMPYGPTTYFALYNTVLRHDITTKKKMTLATPKILFHGFNTQLGVRVQTILANLFPPSSDDSCVRTMTFYNNDDFVSFRHHRVDKDYKSVDLEEMGPRFEMRLFRIRLGALDQPEAKAEWELRPFMNSAKRRKFLGTAAANAIPE